MGPATPLEPYKTRDTWPMGPGGACSAPALLTVQLQVPSESALSFSGAKSECEMVPRGRKSPTVSLSPTPESIHLLQAKTVSVTAPAASDLATLTSLQCQPRPLPCS